MTLTEWIDQHVEKHGSRKAVCMDLAERLEQVGTPITWQTLTNIDRGMRIVGYTRAKALSDLTEGAVTVAELCE